MGFGGNGSQRDGRGRLDGAGGHRMRVGRWARRGCELWGMESVAVLNEEIVVDGESA